MSRIGKMPIGLPAGVSVEIDGHNISVTGKKGSLSRTIHPDISVELKDNEIVVNGLVESKKNKAFRGLTRTLINNMVIGVDQGFTKALVIEGVGYRASMSGTDLSLNVGYSNPVQFSLPGEVKASVQNNTKIVLESIDKEILGLTAAKLRAVRKPEPYKGKGIRYEGEYIQRKAGKTAAK
ncbi:MAG: 50S ribosomal protein L6 [Desulfofustis sp. PB-SRB1]|jgi:large subunit ribosomal protein L6|nr:50S ribosomal protein L6 [Desulfofustis sp. PB-SRB1]MBM1002445.1 50S ribosomal protein L6 [Desulfofustis sp. PB-SRB1]HBH30060.1 50S ribosomal protein L6 [Desulfofustis sp.]HBH31838.1 50S ribosomal protein L6 [Desulfofustis sp.]